MTMGARREQPTLEHLLVRDGDCVCEGVRVTERDLDALGARERVGDCVDVRLAVRVGVRVLVRVPDGVSVWVDDVDGDGVADSEGVSELEGVSVPEGVGVRLTVCVLVGVRDLELVGLCVRDLEPVGLCVRVRVEEGVLVDVGVRVCEGVYVCESVRVWVEDGVLELDALTD